MALPRDLWGSRCAFPVLLKSLRHCSVSSFLWQREEPLLSTDHLSQCQRELHTGWTSYSPRGLRIISTAIGGSWMHSWCWFSWFSGCIEATWDPISLSRRVPGQRHAGGSSPRSPEGSSGSTGSPWSPSSPSLGEPMRLSSLLEVSSPPLCVFFPLEKGRAAPLRGPTL